MRRRSIAISCWAAVACGCGPFDEPASPAASIESTSQVEADTEMACARTHGAGSWTQLVYRTETWRTLAERADRRDPAAWREIANLIERHRRGETATACTEQMAREVRATAARLAG